MVMKKAINILNTIGYGLLLPFAWVSYIVVDRYRSLKRSRVSKTGRVTKYNPYSDKW